VPWGTFIYRGVERDLAHLDAFTFIVKATAEGARAYKVLVSFSHHVFTRDIMDGDRAADAFGPPHDLRCFCDDRHQRSKALPAIIAAAATGKAYFPGPGHPQQRNFLLIDIGDGDPPYLVVFNLEKATAMGVDVRMFVVSAHPRPGLPARSRMNSIRFATLISKVARGEKIVRPPAKK